MEDNARTMLRTLVDRATPVQIAVYASYRFSWDELSWDGEAGVGPDGPGVCGTFRRSTQADEHWSRPAGTPQEAVDALRAEAERLLLLHGTPVGGHRVVVTDGDARKLARAEKRGARVDSLLAWVSRLAEHLPLPLGRPLGEFVLRVWSRRAMKERSY